MNDSLTHLVFFFIISLFFQIRIIYFNLSKIACTNCNNKQQGNIYHLRPAMINTVFISYWLLNSQSNKKRENKRKLSNEIPISISKTPFSYSHHLINGINYFILKLHQNVFSLQSLPFSLYFCSSFFAPRSKFPNHTFRFTFERLSYCLLVLPVACAWFVVLL